MTIQHVQQYSIHKECVQEGKEHNFIILTPINRSTEA